MEAEFLAHLERRLPAHPLLKIGPGDDAAVLDLTARPDCVVTTDLLIDGVHFRLESLGAEQAGYKALAVNLSDLAAMAALPVAVVISLAVPRSSGLEVACRLLEGVLPLADRYQVAIAGGDTNVTDGPLVVSITALGQVTEAGSLTRAGALPGDVLIATGPFGGSLLGHHACFEPKVDEALLLNHRYQLHAGIDVSDGLALDVSRLAIASGCGAVLCQRQIAISSAGEQAAADDGRTSLEHALSDGEDFELVLAVSSAEAKRILAERPLDGALYPIGRMVEQAGLWMEDRSGRLTALTAKGYLHGTADDERV